ncbi:hypothetical protein [Burkholderia cepacia]|uniref:hypothetical protein n=1 Tax=Burkholderia cepacia TaxID=292 RepID=UPI000F59F4C2|nr:hypothetical protein [Burkholderia cepacia]
MPLLEGAEVLRPERAILRLPYNRTIDIGALCYLKRESVVDRAVRPQSVGRKVVLASKSTRRLQRVRRLIDIISSEVRCGGRRLETIRDRYSRFIAFMNWADASGWESVLEDDSSARDAFQAYVNYLRDRVARNDMALNSGARQQFTVLPVLAELMGFDDLGRGLNLLRADHNLAGSTSPPDHAAQARVLSLCDALFVGLSALVLNNAPYPHALTVPAYLGIPENRLWIFPTTVWFMLPSTLAKRSLKGKPSWGYNYAAGRVSTLQELTEVNGCDKYARNKNLTAIRRARLTIEEANADSCHLWRRMAALQAMNVFIVLFLSQTGMNWAQVVGLSWRDDFEIDVAHQAFRTIKWRAGGKTVTFELPVAFMPTFRRYLELRRFLLRGAMSEYLFFKMGAKAADPPKRFGCNGLFAIYVSLRRIDPAIPTVLARQWRAAKSDWLVRNTDPATTALVLQNTEKTVLATYAEGSETVQVEEMTNLFDQVCHVVLEKGVKVVGAVTRAVGLCKSYGSPASTESTGAMQPDCKGPEGCLFCDNFKVHADEIDTRKLLSCGYCLRQTQHMAGSEERVQKLLGPIFGRIEVILEEIRKRDYEMVNRVTQEVDEEGELDPYWARKLEMLMELGVAG